MNKTFQTKSILEDSWKITKKNIKLLIGVVIVLWGVQFATNYLQNISDNSAVLLFFSLISWVIGSLMSIGLISVSLSLVKNNTATYKDALTNTQVLGKYLLGSIYYGLIVFAGILLFIVPGVIWALRYQFYSYLIIDKSMSPKEALAKSKEMTQGQIGKLAVFGLVISLINVLGLLLVGVGLLVTIPLTMVAMALIYKKLAGEVISSNTSTPAGAPTSNQDAWKNYRQTRSNT